MTSAIREERINQKKEAPFSGKAQRRIVGGKVGPIARSFGRRDKRKEGKKEKRNLMKEGTRGSVKISHKTYKGPN